MSAISRGEGLEVARGGPAQQGDVSALLPVDAAARANLRILIVDDDRSLCESCVTVLKVEGYQLESCTRGNEAVELLRRKRFDIVLIDLYMSQVSGMELLRVCIEAQPSAIALVITGKPSVESSIEALRAGAWDYLPKPFSATHLQVLIGRAAHAAQIARESQELQTELEKQHGNSEKLTVLGISPAFRSAIELARKVARTDASVFVSGESGTGKELIAQFIHQHSRRSSRGIVAVNCAALPEALLESEMFGHRKGAFTGAVQDKPGLLEEANGGTLFLDELADMPVPLQAKLLRVIQDGVVRRVGSTKTDALVNVRFVSATNRDPAAATEAGLLREDLFYRLSVVPIRVPPLRKRQEDIPLLARHFLGVYWNRHRDPGTPLPVLTDDAIRSLQNRTWPGNVRELQNVIEHAVVLLDPGSEIQPDDLLRSGDDAPAASRNLSLTPDLLDEKYHPARDRLISDFERTYITRLVDRAGGNLSRAARIAGVDRTTLYRLMDKHGLTVQRLIEDPVAAEAE